MSNTQNQEEIETTLRLINNQIQPWIKLKARIYAHIKFAIICSPRNQFDYEIVEYPTDEQKAQLNQIDMIINHIKNQTLTKTSNNIE